MLFRLLLVAFISSYVTLAFADSATILQIQNTRKQPLLLKSAGNEDLKIAAGTFHEVVVLGKSDARLLYASGEIQGLVKWGFDQTLASITDKCRRDGEDNPQAGVIFCRFRFVKVGKALLTGSTFDLERQSRAILPIKHQDLEAALSLFSPSRNVLYSRIRNPLGNATIAQLTSALEGADTLHQLQTALGTLQRGMPIASREPEQHVLLFGDQGTGDEKARRVAKDMYALCNLEGCDYALSTGDNIYPKGPKISDANWRTEFSKKFTATYFPLFMEFGFPFFMTLGNHDIGVDSMMNADWLYLQRFRKELAPEHFLNERLGRMKAQVAFAQDEENPKAKDVLMWNMPNYEYSEMITKNGIDTYLVSLNTNYFPGEITPDGSNPEKNTSQLDWLVRELQSEGARKSNWRVVFGHHALFSIGRHGVNTGKLGFSSNDKDDMVALRKKLLPVLCENKVDFYLAGHDHHLQVDLIQCDNGHNVMHVISGAAAKADAESAWGEWVPGSSNAFTAKALYKEFRWGNNLFAEDIKNGLIAKRMLGFAILRLGKKVAQIDMVESTKHGPQTLACFRFDSNWLLGRPCAVANLSALFLRGISVLGS